MHQYDKDYIKARKSFFSLVNDTEVNIYQSALWHFESWFLAINTSCVIISYCLATSCLFILLFPVLFPNLLYHASWPSLKLQFLFFCLNNIILVAWKLTNLKKWPLSQSFQNISWSFSVDKDCWVNHPYLTKEQTFTHMIQWVAAPAKDNSDVLESSQKKTLQAFPVWSIAFLFLCHKIKLKYLSY